MENEPLTLDFDAKPFTVNLILRIGVGEPKTVPVCLLTFGMFWADESRDFDFQGPRLATLAHYVNTFKKFFQIPEGVEIQPAYAYYLVEKLIGLATETKKKTSVTLTHESQPSTESTHTS